MSAAPADGHAAASWEEARDAILAGLSDESEHVNDDTCVLCLAIGGVNTLVAALAAAEADRDNSRALSSALSAMGARSEQRAIAAESRLREQEGTP